MEQRAATGNPAGRAAGRGKARRPAIAVRRARSEREAAWRREKQPETAEQPPPVRTEALKQSVSEPPASQAPAVIDTPPKAQGAAPARQRRNAPVYSFRAPQTIPPEGVAYKIRWGDTLWDISEAFYRNPWLYPVIVRRNRIRNANLIVSGTEITIPARD
jgi:nucleoid-associated protein YgaU